MSRSDLGDYEAVNEAWGKATTPRPTGLEALSAAKRLYTRWMKRPWSGTWKLTSGRRHTYPRGSVFYVNPRSWESVVHGVSHHCHRRLHPGSAFHDATHAVIECEMIEYVLTSGWLAGKLRPKAAAPVDPIRARYEAVLRRIERWQAKERRAAHALRKLKHQRAYYEKRFAAEPTSA